MNPSRHQNRKPRSARIGVEALEGRALLTGGAGNTVAIMPGTIDKANGTASITFTIDPTHFHLPHGTLTLGIDVAPQSGSTVKPTIVSVAAAQGKIVAATTHARYGPGLSSTNGTNSKVSSAVLTPVSFPKGSTQPVTYTVNVKAQGNSSGKFLLGFYLPGDANGDGQVTQADLTIIRKDMGANANTSKYSFDADANRDGRINRADLTSAQKNLGVSTTISPVVSTNLDPASDSGLPDRVTNIQSVHFTGSASPGATVTYSALTASQPPITSSTTADSSGNYSLMLALGNGQNTIQVTTHDTFGQSISGSISPVTYSVNAPPAFTTTTTATN